MVNVEQSYFADDLEIQRLNARIAQLESRLKECQESRAFWKQVATARLEILRNIHADGVHLKQSIDEAFEEFGKSFPEDTWDDGNK